METFFSISEQTQLFLGSVLLGLPIGLLLDGFRFLRMLLPHHSAAVFLEDSALTAGAMFLLQTYAVMFGRSEMRGYFCIGAALGFLLYLLTIGCVLTRMRQKLCHAAAKGRRILLYLPRKIRKHAAIRLCSKKNS